MPNQPINTPGLKVYIVNVGGVLFYTDVQDNLEDLAGLATVEAVRSIIPKLFSLARGGQVSEKGRIGQLINSSNAGIAGQEAEVETEAGAAVLEDVA